eukprot:scaffold1221_cov237-Pinguiococcus_pyrenoidosus.AAC.11
MQIRVVLHLVRERVVREGVLVIPHERVGEEEHPHVPAHTVHPRRSTDGVVGAVVTDAAHEPAQQRESQQPQPVKPHVEVVAPQREAKDGGVVQLPPVTSTVEILDGIPPPFNLLPCFLAHLFVDDVFAS